MTVLSVVIVDDHRVVREGLKALFQANEGFRIAGEASDGVSGIALVRNASPDVLILDLMLPRLSGIEVIRETRTFNKRVNIVVLTMHANESYAAAAFRSGASAYVLKDAGFREIRLGIAAARQGHRYVSSSLSSELVDVGMTDVQNTSDPYEMLSLRERQILCMVAAGLTSAEISDQINISRRTTEAHRASIWKKLGFRSQAELVRFAIDRGLAGPERH